MKSLILGSSGQDGYYLNKKLEKENHEVFRASRKNSDFNGNIGEFSFLKSLIEDIKPDFIFNFAAKSSTEKKFAYENLNSIVNGTYNILNAVLELELDTKIFLSGSALQFLNKGNPIDEDTKLESNNFYSLMRNHSLEVARFYRQEFKMKIYYGYFFNHDSPLRKKNFFNQKIVNLAKKKDFKNKINLGNLDAVKEFGYAKDLMDALFIFVNQDKYNELVMGTGKGHSLREWVKICFEMMDKNYKEFIIEEGLNLKKPLVSNPKKLYSLGWNPKYDINNLAKIMLEKN